VGDSDTDAFGAKIEAEIARRRVHGSRSIPLSSFCPSLPASRYNLLRLGNPGGDFCVSNKGTEENSRGMASRRPTTAKSRGSWGRVLLAVLLLLLLAGAGGVAFVLLTPFGPQTQTF